MMQNVPRFLYLLAFLLLSNTLMAQTPNYSWAKTINGSANDTVTDMVAGKGEYIYALGHYTSASLQLGGQTLTNSGVKDIFVAKYDTAGNLLWAKNMGGAGTDNAVAIATDSLDNIYITGRCDGNASFGALTFTGTNFIAKLNANGDVQWVTEPATNVNINDIAADPAGNFVICGTFTGNCTIGGTAVAVTEETDGFVARYNASGSMSWYKQLYGLKATVNPQGSEVSEVCKTVAIAPNGHIGLGGYTGASKLVVKSAAAIDTIFTTSVTWYSMRNRYGTAGLLMQWDATGNLLWIKDNLYSNNSGYNDTSPYSLATDPNANLYVAYEIVERALNYSPRHVRLGKYNSMGDIEWIKSIAYYYSPMHGWGIAYPRVACSGGKVYFSERNTNIGSGSNNAGNTRVYCFSQYGTLQWTSVYCNGYAAIYALAAKETAYTGGIINKDIYNPNSSFANLSVATTGGSDGIVAKVQNYIPPIVPLGFSASNPDKTICTGGSIGLAQGILATGGVEPYTYSWTPAASLNNAALLNAMASPTATTQYILTVTDAQGWQLKDTVVVNVQPPLPKPTIQLIKGISPSTYDTLVCVSPATGLSYRWEVSSYTGQSWNNWPVTAAKIPIDQGQNNLFRVTITNGLNGCTAISDLFYYKIIKANAGRDTTICSGQSVTLGGTPPYIGMPYYNGNHMRYWWSPLPYAWPYGMLAEGVQNPYVTVAPTVTTSYLVFLDEGTGYPRISDTVTVTVVAGAPTPTVTASGPTTFCEGDSVILTSSPAQTYRWSNGATTQSIKVTTSGTYSLTVGSGSGCNSFGSAPVTVTVHPRPDKPIVGSSSSPHFCLGDSVKLSTPQAYAYLWSNGATIQQPTVYTSGNYSVQTLNALGCKSVPSDTIAVTANPRPAVPTVTANRPFNGPGTVINLCHGDSVTLTASASPGYMWNNAIGNTQSITVKSDGIYYVWAVNGGCMNTTASEGIMVFAYPTIPAPTITASGPTSFCQGGSVTLTASNTPQGYYLWSNGATTQSITVNNSGNYSVRAVVGNGSCQSQPSAATTVTVLPASATPTVTASGPTTFCQGVSVTLTASAANGYLWSNGATTQSITVNSSGSYTVRAVNANGCPSAVSAVTNVTVNPTPATPVINTSGPTSFCQGGSVALTASAASSYLWSNGATTQSIAVNNSGSYTVRVTNASGCQSAVSAATNVTVNPAPATPAITASGTTTFCQGGNVVLTSSAGSSYLWSNGATTQSITVNSSGSYTVQVTNASGCQSAASAPTTVTVLPTPSAPTITANGPTTFCQGGNVVLTNSAGSSYLWSNGATTQSITVSNSGSYTVRVTNSNGCQSAASAPTNVTVNPLPPVPTITQSGNTLSSSSPSGNQWYYNGVAIAGATAQTYTYTIGGIFSLTVTNANGCSSSSVPYTGLRMAANTLRSGDAFYHQVSPNPTAQNATARYQLKNAAMVSVYIANDRGERVLTLVNQQQQAAGIYTYPVNRNGVGLQRGNYYVIYVINGERFTQTIMML